MEVHWGYALSLLLFRTIMKEATKKGGGGTPWEVLYADDLVDNAESAEVKEKLNKWKEGMKERGLKINIEKTKYKLTGKKAREKLNPENIHVDVVGRE